MKNILLKVVLPLIGFALVLALLKYGFDQYQHRRLTNHIERTIAQHADSVAADARARCAADQQAAFLAGRQYEFHHSDSIRRALRPAHSLPALPEHPPRQ